MKNIQLFIAEKYNDKAYRKIENGVYGYGDKFVISLSFIQEPEYGEEESAQNISQYPLEDLLQQYFVYVSDFYKELNRPDSKKCYLEFCSPKLERVQKFKEIIGKHIYNVETQDNGETYVELRIE